MFETFFKPKPEGVVKPQKKEREKKTDKGFYESVVTNNYFEGWDEELELQGNAGIKDKIKENIINAEKRNREIYEYIAHNLKISVEEFKERLQTKVEEMVDKAEFFRATNVDVLEKVVNVDGRWKNQFETGTSNGSLDPRYRASQEIQMFGFNKKAGPDPDDPYGEDITKDVLDSDKDRRPIYGYFSDNEHGGINHVDGKIPPPPSSVVMELLILK